MCCVREERDPKRFFAFPASLQLWCHAFDWLEERLLGAMASSLVLLGSSGETVLSGQRGLSPLL